MTIETMLERKNNDQCPICGKPIDLKHVERYIVQNHPRLGDVVVCPTHSSLKGKADV